MTNLNFKTPPDHTKEYLGGDWWRPESYYWDGKEGAYYYINGTNATYDKSGWNYIKVTDEKMLSNLKKKYNKINLLISTTVIEVGIDVPNATVMLIEHAERFGLTQLHQLRGRVGRGNKKSYCILVQRKQTENSKKRLQIMESTNDGFVISDEDLKLRGPGEFFGIKQSGFFNFKIANIVSDGNLINQVRNAVFEEFNFNLATLQSRNKIVYEELMYLYGDKIEKSLSMR